MYTLYVHTTFITTLMGIRGLFGLIEKYAPNAISKKSYKDIADVKQDVVRTVCVDASNCIYSTVIGIRRETSLCVDDIHIFGIFCKLVSMLHAGIVPIMVFDGNPPSIKKKKVKHRADKSSIKHIDRSVYDDSKILARLMGVHVVQSLEEADSQCAALDIMSVSNGVVSNDTDMLVFGAKKLLRNFSNTDDIIEITLSNVLKGLGLSTQLQFIDLCILIGGDYCDNVTGMNASETYDLFMKCGMEVLDCIEMMKKMSNVHVPKTFSLQWQHARLYYQNANVLIDVCDGLPWKEPQRLNIFNYLCREHGFNEEEVIYRIDLLDNKHKEYLAANAIRCLSSNI